MHHLRSKNMEHIKTRGGMCRNFRADASGPSERVSADPSVCARVITDGHVGGPIGSRPFLMQVIRQIWKTIRM